MTYLLTGLATVGAGLFFYLTLSNQQWLKVPLPAGCRPLALVALAASFGVWMWIMDGKAGFFAALVMLMLVLGVLPLLALLKSTEEK
ncbi:MAG: hypothetical protein CL537_15505 [Alcanivoracaceae bacterium]|nr:hypothetical protein [Alcanivoracaceae bacterium]MCG8438599.1 hypothetical protein [Pseudomonadales bacterium]|tara:strand:+ start:5829 stop:6089 length:261 start_codon:yes stop_codon:yes gene_type:complete